MLPSFSRGWPRTISTGGRLMESAIGGEGAGQTWREQGRRRWVPHPPGSTKSQHPPRANARRRLMIGRGATKAAALEVGAAGEMVWRVGSEGGLEVGGAGNRVRRSRYEVAEFREREWRRWM